MRFHVTNFSIRSLALALALGSGSGAAWAGSVSSFNFNFSSSSSNKTPIDSIVAAPTSFTSGDSDNVSHAGGPGTYTYGSSITYIANSVQLNVQGGVVAPSDEDGNGPVSGATFIGDGQYTQANSSNLLDYGVYVGEFPGGLGVGFEIFTTNGSTKKRYDIDDDRHTVDDNRGDDFIVLQFDQDVAIDALFFGYVSSTSINALDFRIYNVDNPIAEGVYESAPFIGSLVFDTDNLDDRDEITGWNVSSSHVSVQFSDLIQDRLVGQNFVIQAGGSTNENGRHYVDYWKFNGISGYTVIPSPSAALFGTVGITVLVGRRRLKV